MKSETCLTKQYNLICIKTHSEEVPGLPDRRKNTGYAGAFPTARGTCPHRSPPGPAPLPCPALP